MIVDPISVEIKLQTYIRAAKKQQYYYDKELDTEENESEEDIDEAIDELKHEINELKEIQQI